MSYTVCTIEDFKRIKVGNELKINARYENLKRENGEIMEFVAKKDDVVVVKRNMNTHLIVCFYEDTVELSTKNREFYGEFVVEPKHVQKI